MITGYLFFPFSLDKQRDNRYRHDNITHENVIVHEIITHENVIINEIITHENIIKTGK